MRAATAAGRVAASAREKALVSAADGGSPVRSKVMRRMRERESAGWAGERPALAREARRKRSRGWRAGSGEAGGSGLEGGWKAQCWRASGGGLMAAWESEVNAAARKREKAARGRDGEGAGMGGGEDRGETGMAASPRLRYREWPEG